MRPARAGHGLVDVYPWGPVSCFSAGRRTVWRARPCETVTTRTTNGSLPTSSPCWAAWSEPGSKDPHTEEDLVQETLPGLMSSATRVDPDKLHHYGAVTARHVVASYAERNDRARNRSHLLAEPAHDVNASSTLPATCLSARPAASSPTGSSSAAGGRPGTTSCGCR